MFSNTEFVPVNTNDGNNNNWMWAIILFFGLLVFNGGFFGGNRGNNGVGNGAEMAAMASMFASANNSRSIASDYTDSAVQRGFDTASIIGKLDGITNGLCQLGYDNLAQVNNVNQNVMQQGYNTQSAIAQLGYQNQQCCCETNRNIDAVRYENAKNTCDIINAQNAGVQRILDRMCQSEIQGLRDTNMMQAFQLSQQAQNATLISTLLPTPTPSYLTCSPYQSQALALSNLSSGCGCA
jgi:hypothetical protein